MAGVLASVVALLLVPAARVDADCGSQPSPPDVVGVAFSGRVSATEVVEPGMYAITIGHRRTLGGQPLDPVTLEAVDASDCHMLDGSLFRVGDQLIVIATKWIDDNQLLLPIAWRKRPDGSWGYGVVADRNRVRFGADLRAIDSLPEIRSYVRDQLPSTDAPAALNGSSAPSAVLSALFGGLGAAWFLMARRRRGAGRRDDRC